MEPTDFLRKDIYQKGNITLVEFLPDGRIRAQNTKDGKFFFHAFRHTRITGTGRMWRFTNLRQL